MRVELIHPMLIHFPLALLLVGCGLKITAFFARRHSYYRAVLFMARLVLSIGVSFAWAAVGAGELASNVVEKTLCQPEALETHSTLAYTASIVFTAGVILDWGREWKKLRSYKRMMAVFSSLLLLAGTIVLITAGFFGGSLVYDQGAAVQKQC